MRVSHAFVTYRLVGGLFWEICMGYAHHSCTLGVIYRSVCGQKIGFSPVSGRAPLWSEEACGRDLRNKNKSSLRVVPNMITVPSSPLTHFYFTESTLNALYKVGMPCQNTIHSTCNPVDRTARFAAVEFHYFMHMRVKTICILEPRLLGVELL